MDLQNEAIELQKVFHQDYKTYWEETKAIKDHLESRFKALGLNDVSQSEQLCQCQYVDEITEDENWCRHCEKKRRCF